MPTDLLGCLLLIAAFTPPDSQLSDRSRFPNADAAKNGLKIARAYRCELEAAAPLSLHRMSAWRDQCKDAKARYDCWDWLNAAQGGEGRGPDYWLYSLRRLRELIGEHEYFAGIMPFPVPICEISP